MRAALIRADQRAKTSYFANFALKYLSFTRESPRMDPGIIPLLAQGR